MTPSATHTLRISPQEYWQRRGTSYVPADDRDAELVYLLRWMRQTQPASVLDVGSGRGDVYAFLQANDALPPRYQMVDFVNSMRDACQDHTGVLPHFWDGKVLPYYDNEFDAVLSFYVMLHVPPGDIANVFAEHVRVAQRWVFVVTLSRWDDPENLAPHCFLHDYARLCVGADLWMSRAWPVGDNNAVYVMRKGE